MVLRTFTSFKYVKGIYHRHHPLSKYVDTWNINLVLPHYDYLDRNGNLKEQILKKSVMLFLIIDVRREQTLFTVNIENISFKIRK